MQVTLTKIKNIFTNLIIMLLIICMKLRRYYNEYERHMKNVGIRHPYEN